MAIADALEVADFVSDGSHHAADFTVLAFDKHEFRKTVFEIDVRRESDFFRCVGIFGVADIDSVDKALGCRFAELARCPNVVTARDFETRVREAVKQFAIVGEQQKAAALQVQSSNVFKVVVSRRQVIVNGAAALRIVLGADAAGGLVEHDDFSLLVRGELQEFPIDHHLVFCLVHLMTEIRNRFTVHLDAATGDKFVCGAAACKTTERNVFVDAPNYLSSPVSVGEPVEPSVFFAKLNVRFAFGLGSGSFSGG